MDTIFQMILEKSLNPSFTTNDANHYFKCHINNNRFKLSTKNKMSSQVGVQKAKIVVVGAGISGIVATRRLFRLGFQDVTLLEASRRIGGRIKTTSFSDGWVEMGAQWIHGKDNNVVHEYATENGLVLDPDRRGTYEMNNVQYRTEDGLRIDDNLCQKTFEKLTMTLHDIKKFEDRNEPSIERYLDEKFLEYLEKSHVATGSDEHRIKVGLLECFKRLQCSVDGCDSLSELSPRSISNYQECEGNPLTNLKKGYSAVVRSLAQDIPDSTIFFEKQVDRIEIVENRGIKRPAVRVSCSDGSKYEANHVIVTVSLGVLKHNADTMFVSPLTVAKKRAITDMGFGTVDKILLQFERPFWPANTAGYNIIRTDRRSAPSAIDDNDDVDDHDWSKAIFGFYVVPFASNVLCGWLSGEGARRMEAITDDSEVESACLEVLRRHTGRADIPKVVKILRSTWHSDPYIRGSYSYLKKELPDSKLANDVLAEPIYVTSGGSKCPVVLFAGEATHPYYYSTVHGAWETGEREAKRIVDYYSSGSASSATAKL